MLSGEESTEGRGQGALQMLGCSFAPDYYRSDMASSDAEQRSVETAPENHPRCNSRIRELTEPEVEEVFEEVRSGEDPHQMEYLTGLYNRAYGFDVMRDDGVVSIKGFPSVSPTLGEVIQNKALTFDQKYHPDVIPGGLWVNNGFSVDPELDRNAVRLARLVIETSVIADVPVFSL